MRKVGHYILQISWDTASIVVSRSFDPWYNLALEEMLLHGTKQQGTILYLWQNHNTVVIGRNQNVWKECRWEQLHNEGGKLARRLSGGGAVYHDKGNLNFTFITRRREYDLEKQLQVILEGVAELGIPAKFSGRNDILAQGRKFSGNAFYKDADRAYHHGTILVAVDFAQMSRYLQVSREKMVAKGIESVQARVVNLTEFRPDLDIESVAESLKKSFRRIYAPPVGEVVVEGLFGELPQLYEKYSSWEWRFGQTPAFDLVLEKRFPWGGIELAMALEAGRIREAKVFSDAMEPHLIQAMGPALEGVLLDKEAMVDSLQVLKKTPQEKAIIEDITEWLSLVEI